MSNQLFHGYALLIGVGKTRYSYWSLPITVSDAQALRDVLTDPNYCAYPADDHHIHFIHDDSATRESIFQGLDWLTACIETNKQATALIYFSGHGWLDKSSNEYYLIPHDVDPQNIPESAINGKKFTERLRAIQARQLWVILDCCHAGGMATSKASVFAPNIPSNYVPTSLPKTLSEMAAGRGRVIFMSSSDDQLSWLYPERKLSVYTFHLIEALKGAGCQPDEREVRLSNIINYVGRTVPITTRTLHQADQIPFFDAAAQDFPVALVQGGKGISSSRQPQLDHESEAKPISQANTASGQDSVAIGDISGGNVYIGKNSAFAIGQGSHAQVGQPYAQPTSQNSGSVEPKNILAIFMNAATIFDVEQLNEAQAIRKNVTMFPTHLHLGDDILPVYPFNKLLQKLQNVKPDILYLVGNGSPEGLQFAYTNVIVPWTQLNDVIMTSQVRFECIIISSAFSIMRAADLRSCAKYVIAATPGLTEAAAATFAQAFYAAIGQGENTSRAYEHGRRQVQQAFPMMGDVLILLQGL